MGLARMRFTARTVAALTAFAAPAALAAVPFSLDFYRANGIAPPHVPDGFLVAGIVIEKLLIAELGIVIGLLISSRTGLAKSAVLGEKELSVPEQPSQLLPIVAQAAAIGCVVGLAIIATAWLFLVQLRLDPEAGPAEVLAWIQWKRALAGLSAGVIEELFFRLGVMTAFVWVFARLTGQTQANPRTIWVGIVSSTLPFAAIHLLYVGLTLAVISPVVLGLVCAWLYWRRGLEAAIVAHASFDVFISVVAPAIGIPI